MNLVAFKSQSDKISIVNEAFSLSLYSPFVAGPDKTIAIQRGRGSLF